ncbi:MAG: hypothetical protein IKL20_06130 [Alistipes sp.]|nr:hypothetical protein [Alistipes sp.]
MDAILGFILGCFIGGALAIVPALLLLIVLFLIRLILPFCLPRVKGWFYIAVIIVAIVAGGIYFNDLVVLIEPKDIEQGGILSGLIVATLLVVLISYVVCRIIIPVCPHCGTWASGTQIGFESWETGNYKIENSQITKERDSVTYYKCSRCGEEFSSRA